MAFDYSQLFQSSDGIANTWREIYNYSLSFPENVLSILKKTVFLPYDFYDIVTAYLILPSALSRIVPYLFLYGQSGSGKTTVAKLACKIHGIKPNSPTDTFAGMRNDIDMRRYGNTDVVHPEDEKMTYRKQVEVNTHMVWEDIDPGKFAGNPDLYRLFKVGYDRSTDKITISSKEVGENLEFKCFCPKTFSSISPLHLDDRFRELKRRLIVIPFKRVEELNDERKGELGITNEDYHQKLIDIDVYDWKEFDGVFKEFWDLSLASSFMKTRKALSKSVKGLTSQQRAISLDLMATGISSGIWTDIEQATERMKLYWKWFKGETEENAGLSQLLADYIKQEARNAQTGNTNLAIPVSQLRTQLDIWTHQGWLLERPRTSSIKELMLDLGMRLRKGYWIKG